MFFILFLFVCAFDSGHKSLHVARPTRNCCTWKPCYERKSGPGPFEISRDL